MCSDAKISGKNLHFYKRILSVLKENLIRSYEDLKFRSKNTPFATKFEINNYNPKK